MKENVKYKVFDNDKVKKVEFIVALCVGIVFLIMLSFAVTDKVFIPITLVTLALFLFSICYYYIEEKSKRKLVYTLFSLGVLLIVFEVIYTLVSIVYWKREII